MNTSWTKEDFKIYLLIYCSYADFSEDKVETDYIKSKIKSSNFDAIQSEFEGDNDFQSIQKIQAAIKEHGYKHDDALIEEIKELFTVDHHFDILEQNLFRVLKKIV